MISLLQTSALLFALSITSVSAVPFLDKRSITGPVITTDFADPAIKLVGSTWYAFATGQYGKHVQVATSPDFKTWTVLNKDALPNLPSWVVPDTPTGSFVWAPDMVPRSDGRFVLYYAANVKNAQPKASHCVGAAVSQGTDPSGPYIPLESKFACPLDKGGAIDPAGFQDKDGQNYVVYKVDGNNIGHGGNCNNGVEPLVPTPIMIQKVASDLVTPVGNPIQILDRDAADGPLVEAPSLNYLNGIYYLFFSSNCYSSTWYDVSYATATSVTGPYTKAHAPVAPLLVTGSFGLTSPGGADVTVNGDKIAFHANYGSVRAMWVAEIKESNHVVTI